MKPFDLDRFADDYVESSTKCAYMYYESYLSMPQILDDKNYDVSQHFIDEISFSDFYIKCQERGINEKFHSYLGDISNKEKNRGKEFLLEYKDGRYILWYEAGYDVWRAGPESESFIGIIVKEMSAFLKSIKVKRIVD